MKNVSISILTSVYNTPAKYLYKYFDSLFSQTFQDYEIIIIDDGSVCSDTINVLLQYTAKYPYLIKLIKLNSNHGISYCRNLALKHMRGEYFTVLDSDDWYDNDFLSSMYDIACSSDADMVVSGYRLCNSTGEVMSEEPQNAAILQNIYYQIASTIGPRIAKASIVQNNSLLYPNHCLVEDLPFNALLFYYCNKIETKVGYGYNIRIHRQSTSHDSLRYSSLNEKNIPLNYIENSLKKIGIGKRTTIRESIFIGNIIMVLSSISCLWCRNSEKAIVKKISTKSGKIIRKYFPHYIISSFQYFKHAPKHTFVMINPILYAICCSFRLESVYALFISALCNFIFRRIKNESNN